MSLMTPREFLAALRYLHPASEEDFERAVRSLESDEGAETLTMMRAIEALAHERGRQQGLAEADHIVACEAAAWQYSPDACNPLKEVRIAIKQHAAKEAK